MKLSDLLSNISHTVLSASGDPEITGVSRDTRRAESGDLFICTKGARFDTHDPAVLAALSDLGVAAFVVEHEVDYRGDAAVILVENTREAGAKIYAARYGHPEEGLTLIGITGSKGKTTAAHMLYGMLLADGRAAGLIGTNGVRYLDVSREIQNTTPDYDAIAAILREMRDRGIDTVVLEVSSQAMKMHRVDALHFDIGIFLNIQTGDHVGPNEHESFEDYLFCKAELLNRSDLGLLPADDPYLPEIKKLVKVPALTFGTGENADYRAENVRPVFDEALKTPGIVFTAAGRIGGKFFVNLPGDFNALNALSALAASERLGVGTDKAAKALSELHITARDEIIYRGRFSVCVDFAHNGESTWAHLRAMREYRPKRLICVFGADGNRSIGRRLGMGEAAGTLADLAIVTSGHNRFETFEQILADTEIGLKKAPDPHYIAIKNRKEAIRYALKNAKDGDLITVIGLGHEHWQEENGVKIAYNDAEFVHEVLREMGLETEEGQK